MSERLFDDIHNVEDLRQYNEEDLTQICDELRDELIKTIAKIGGHLGAGLGVVELSVALHYIFNTPHDKIIWDVGHQSYPHKMLTERKHLLHTIRQKGGISGFTKRSESPFDCFGTGHSSTSISAGLGMAVARDISGDDNHVVSVIGDGAMSAGMAYEALNNVGGMKTSMIVILNDNDMSISKPVGAMSHYLSRVLSSKPYISLRHLSLNILEKMPNFVENSAKKAEEYMRGLMTGGTLFEELGFYYIGPVDGHNMQYLLPILRNAKAISTKIPVLVHVRTEKGKGYSPAEQASDKFHGVSVFNPNTGESLAQKSNIPTYTDIVGHALTKYAHNDEKIIGITAAMPSGTGMNIMQKEHPTRVFDVGIAEQHAVTFAAGLATEHYKPFVAIYSTFLQRAYDQVIHDVVLQNLPVRFIIDRAGLVGADGATHAGAYDLSYLCCLPNMVVLAPSDEHELQAMLDFMVSYDAGPIAVRFPRGQVRGTAAPLEPTVISLAKGRIVQQGQDIAIVNLGARLNDIELAIDSLNNLNITPTIMDARFAKPIDSTMLLEIAASHKAIITIEEGAQGGFASIVNNCLIEHDMLSSLKVRNLYLPDRLIDHASPKEQYKDAGLDSSDIANIITIIHTSIMGH